LEAFYRNRQLGITLTLADLSHRLPESWGQMVEKEGMKFQSQAEPGHVHFSWRRMSRKGIRSRSSRIAFGGRSRAKEE
jgi:hypothetical protein